MGEKISFIDLFGTELELEDEYAREMLADESAARAEDVAVLEARMDTFTALPAGSTSGDAELRDIRVGADGVTYPNAGDAVRGQMSLTANKIKAIIPNIFEYNKLTSVPWTSGKYVVPTTGDLANNSTYSACDYVTVTSNEQYDITKLGNLYGAFYDSSKTYISGIQNQSTANTIITVIAPETAKFIRLSCPTDRINELDLSINDTKNLSNDIFINKSNIIDDGEDDNDLTITVKPNGGGDFTTLKEAFESITDSSPDKKYTVEFYGDGTEYDVTSEFESTDNTVGLMVPAFTKLVGIGGKQKNILVARLNTTSQSFSTLNLHQTSELKGLKIIGYNTNYAVHDDFYITAELGHERLIEDVEAISEKTYYYRAWGAGIRSGMKWKFKDTNFGGNQSENEGSFSCHNNVGFTEPASIEFENCRNLSAWTNGTITWGMRISSLVNDANGIINKIKVVGTKMNGLFFTEESSTNYGRGMLWEVTGYGNDANTAVISSSDGVDYSDRIDLI